MNAPRGKLVDHILGNTLDNRRSELRFATNSQNSCNRKVPKNNPLGFKGVSFDRQSGKFRVQIGIRGKRIQMGLHATAEAANAVAVAGYLKYHGEFARVA
jgi:hypothetical protein